MKTLYNLLVHRPNRWYDNLDENHGLMRFLIFFIPLIILDAVLIGTGHDLYFVAIALLFCFWRMTYFAVAELRKIKKMIDKTKL